MKHYLLAAAIAFGLFLQGCGSVVLPTVVKLYAFSPLEADPAGFEIAARMPAGADVPAGGAVFELRMSRTDTGEERSQDFVLQRREATDGRILFRIHPDDLDTLRDLQATAREWETANADASSGSIGMSVSACQTDDTLDPDDTFSVSIKTTEDGPFLPLIRNASVRDALDNADPSDDSDPGTFCE